MKARMIKAFIAGMALSLTMAARVSAGGSVNFNWDNTSSQLANFAAPFYSDQAGTLKLSPGSTSIAGDGFLVQLIALQGGTNFVLASSTIGDTISTLALDISSTFIPSQNGFFDLQDFAVQSNVLAGAYGTGTTPVGIKFFNAATIGAATAYGIVSNNSIFVPNPNWGTPPLASVIFEPDWDTAAYMGPRTLTGPHGFYTDTLIVVPEPSTVFLVGIGLVSLVTLRRRKR